MTSKVPELSELKVWLKQIGLDHKSQAFIEMNCVLSEFQELKDEEIAELKNDKSLALNVLEKKRFVQGIKKLRVESNADSIDGRTLAQNIPEEEETAQLPTIEQTVEDPTLISNAEQEMINAVENEFNSVTKCISVLLSNVNKFEMNTNERRIEIETTFDRLISKLQERKNDILMILEKNLLNEKSKHMERIEPLTKYKTKLESMRDRIAYLQNPNGNETQQPLIAMEIKADDDDEELKVEILISDEEYEFDVRNMPSFPPGRYPSLTVDDIKEIESVFSDDGKNVDVPSPMPDGTPLRMYGYSAPSDIQFETDVTLHSINFDVEIDDELPAGIPRRMPSYEAPSDVQFQNFGKMTDVDFLFTVVEGKDEKMDAEVIVIDPNARKEEILSMEAQFEIIPNVLEITEPENIVFKLNVNAVEQVLSELGTVNISLEDNKAMANNVIEDGDEEGLNLKNHLLLAEIPVKRLYKWSMDESGKYVWKQRADRTTILFHQNKTSYKVRMVVKEKESNVLLVNQWVPTNELIKKQDMVWMWSAFDMTVAKEELQSQAKKENETDVNAELVNKNRNAGFSKWCARFYDDVNCERFEEQFNQARKINLQVIGNEPKLKSNENCDEIRIADGTDAQYYENDEKLCYEMDVWKMYLWQKDMQGTGSWTSFSEKSLIQFFENRFSQKIRIIVRENSSKELKFNHWIPTDGELVSRGEQAWEWKAFDTIANSFLKNSKNGRKLATICATFMDKNDCQKFKQLFEKYQLKNQLAEALN